MIWLLMGAGALGAVLRLLLERSFQPRTETGSNPWTGWPVGVLLANIIGTALLGVLLGYARQHAISLHPQSWASGDWIWLLATGLCGSLSTVSTLFVGVHALGAGQRSRGVCYLFGNLLLALGGGLLGFAVGCRVG